MVLSCELNTKVIFIFKTGNLWWKSQIWIGFFACVIFYWLQNYSYWYQYVIYEVNYIWPAALEMYLYWKITSSVLTHHFILDIKPQMTWISNTLLSLHSNPTLNSTTLHPEAKSSRNMELNMWLNLGSCWSCINRAS